MANGTTKARTESQVYLSTRGGDYDLSFEDVVLKGLAADGGLFLPHEIPVAADWLSWRDLSYPELALRIFSLYISTDEIPTEDLRGIIERSYSTFRADDVVPLVHLQDTNLYLLELFHGPSYSFKDCALQFLGNLFEYILARKNVGKEGKDRHHLTVVGATSGDTGSAAIHGLRGKKDVSVTILHPKGRVSPIQEAQMTTCTDANVYNLAVNGTFDDCQDIVKALFNDPETNAALHLGAVNSINFARILAQIVYYFYSYFSLARKNEAFKIGDKVRYVVPTGNFGDILAGYFATRMGLPVEKLVIATNENDILDRFWKTGRYEKQAAPASDAAGGLEVDGVKAHEGGVRETLSPAMDILVSSNFERLLWFLAHEFASTVGMDEEFTRRQAGQEVEAWLRDLKNKGGFGPVYMDVLNSARKTFESERVSDPQTLETIKDFYSKVGYVLDPHSAVGVTAALRSLDRTGPAVPHISLSTAHPAKFAGAVELALKDEATFNFEAEVLPEEFVGLDKLPKRVADIDNDWKAVREFVKAQVQKEIEG
ncbi:putative threonine synthase [Lasiosphaeris hirsuta]|uniref:Threonine synthase n=1 Tax=Lasiosphaeris hirsuta TaxID=260670 RepID=A0AA40DLH4_9PEZI|nr:putative threonine synthase [Lasiosphaeris hirsuta]